MDFVWDGWDGNALCTRFHETGMILHLYFYSNLQTFTMDKKVLERDRVVRQWQQKILEFRQWMLHWMNMINVGPLEYNGKGVLQAMGSVCGTIKNS